MEIPELIIILCAALAAAGAAALILNRGAPSRQSDAAVEAEPLLFLFEDGLLHHATPSALSAFALLPGTHDWEDLRQTLLPRFPGFPDYPQTGTPGSATVVPGQAQDRGEVTLNWRDSLCWVKIHDAEASVPGPEITAMRQCCATMPDPAWEVLADGTIGWRNAAYRRLTDEGTARPFGTETGRVCLGAGGPDPEWFDITRHTADGRTLCHARRVTDLIEAKKAQRNFVQTLSSTFAHLSIGLAIFDTRQRLAIFNPALVDLTDLRPGFLATRPTVTSFFDQLRENRRMPEPKDYSSWRQQIAEMVEAAAHDTYRETWTLEDGRTWGVQGRPHAEGATAFMFEDISSEVMLTRNFRIEMGQYEMLLDSVEDALVTFSRTGIFTFCNAAYRTLWSHNPEAAFADVTIRDAIDLWRGDGSGAEDWEIIAQGVLTLDRRRRCSLRFSHPDGQRMSCELRPIGPDATMLRFVRDRAVLAPKQARQEQSV